MLPLHPVPMSDPQECGQAGGTRDSESEERTWVEDVIGGARPSERTLVGVSWPKGWWTRTLDSSWKGHPEEAPVSDEELRSLSRLRALEQEWGPPRAVPLAVNRGKRKERPSKRQGNPWRTASVNLTAKTIGNLGSTLRRQR